MRIKEILNSLANADDKTLERVQSVLQGEGHNLDSKQPLLLTKRQVQKLLNISRTTLWRMIKAGILTVVEIYPGMERISSDCIERLLNKRRKGDQND